MWTHAIWYSLSWQREKNELDKTIAKQGDGNVDLAI
jgi:hypothetical protein